MRAFGPFIKQQADVLGDDPSTGDWSERSTSSMVLTLVSRYSMKNAKPTPTTRPMMIPRAILSGLLGRTGCESTLAVSTIPPSRFGQGDVNVLGGDLHVEDPSEILELVELVLASQ